MTNLAETEDKPYEPWANQLALGYGLLAGAVLSALLFGQKVMLWCSIPAALVAIVLLNKAFIRKRGKVVENKAISSLKLPAGWSAEGNVMLPGVGDLDLLITGPGDKRFAIEIKSYECLKKGGWLFGQKLVKGSGKKLTSDPEAQAVRNAEMVNAQPVIWLPEGTGKNFNMRSGLRVVHGNERALRRAIGASRYWFF